MPFILINYHPNKYVSKHLPDRSAANRSVGCVHIPQDQQRSQMNHLTDILQFSGKWGRQTFAYGGKWWSS